jgi:glucose/arabinose dehydrogenase
MSLAPPWGDRQMIFSDSRPRRWATRPAARRILLLLPLMMAAVSGCQDGRPAAAINPDDAAAEVHQLVGQRFRVEVVARGLEIPWGFAWLPDGSMLVTERPGRLRIISPEELRAPGGINGPGRLLAEIEHVEHIGEGGLMGMAISPDFATDRRIYLAHTTRTEDGLRNVIVAYRIADDLSGLADRQLILGDIPGHRIHNGLPLRFGSDGKLYASTGDANEPDLAQQMTSLAGKFLRLNPDGSPPDDNPVEGSLVWTLGHRNAQGFDWHPRAGHVYATEHGPTGGDEVNLVRAGQNYGWPIFSHERNEPPYVAPLRTWTPAIAPSGAVFFRGDSVPAWRNRYFFANLRGQRIVSLAFDSDEPTRIADAEETLRERYGRLRVIEQGPDGMLYVGTSNRDGRGRPHEDDDRILRLVPLRP